MLLKTWLQVMEGILIPMVLWFMFTLELTLQINFQKIIIQISKDSTMRAEIDAHTHPLRSATNEVR